MQQHPYSDYLTEISKNDRRILPAMQKEPVHDQAKEETSNDEAQAQTERARIVILPRDDSRNESSAPPRPAHDEPHYDPFEKHTREIENALLLARTELPLPDYLQLIREVIAHLDSLT